MSHLINKIIFRNSFIKGWQLWIHKNNVENKEDELSILENLIMDEMNEIGRNVTSTLPSNSLIKHITDDLSHKVNSHWHQFPEPHPLWHPILGSLYIIIGK